MVRYGRALLAVTAVMATAAFTVSLAEVSALAQRGAKSTNPGKSRKQVSSFAHRDDEGQPGRGKKRLRISMRSLRHRLSGTSIGQRIVTSTYFPNNWRRTLKLTRILALEYGHLASVITQQSVNAAGDPIPWYTYPAIHYLAQLDFSTKSVFEYGSGNSTLYWAGAAREVVSVEDDRSWFEKMARLVPSNCRLIFEPDLAAFAGTLRKSSDTYDVIVVDGPTRGNTRMKCARAAIEGLRTGGVIILDNSDWLPESARVLRDAGLLEVDMSGFTPINSHPQTTSLFFDRRFDMRPRSARHPQPAVGSTDRNWEPRECVPDPRVEWEGEIFGGITVDEAFTIDSGAGPRTFRVLVYQACGGPALAMLDVDRARVLLSTYSIAEEARHGAAAYEEARRIRQMSWDELRTFVDSSGKGHYVLSS